MRSTIDHDANCAYLALAQPKRVKGCVARTHEVKLPEWDGLFRSVLLDFDRRGRLIGIEVLGASMLLRPETVALLDDITGPIDTRRQHESRGKRRMRRQRPRRPQSRR